MGDLLVIGGAGAYGFTMGSNYNSKPLAAEVLIHGGQPRLIRRRQTFDDLIQGETLFCASSDGFSAVSEAVSTHLVLALAALR